MKSDEIVILSAMILSSLSFVLGIARLLTKFPVRPSETILTSNGNSQWRGNAKFSSPWP